MFDWLRRRRQTKIAYQDVCINALWSAGIDEQLVDRQFHRIQAGLDSPTEFETKLDRVLNDQTARFEFDSGGRLFDPLIVTSPKYDMVVNPGMIRIAQLVTGKSSQYFTFFASGTGTAEEKVSDSRLAAENYRVSMVADGFAEPVGTAMKFAGKFPNVVSTATITEGGVFDFGETNQGTMLFRTVYPPESRLPHLQYRTFYTLTQTINQIPVT